jgi:hypothetical protein
MMLKLSPGKGKPIGAAPVLGTGLRLVRTKKRDAPAVSDALADSEEENEDGQDSRPQSQSRRAKEAKKVAKAISHQVIFVISK